MLIKNFETLCRKLGFEDEALRLLGREGAITFHQSQTVQSAESIEIEQGDQKDCP